MNAASEVASVIVESGAGMVVAPEDGTGLLDAIRALRQNGIAQCRERARTYAHRRWSKEIVLGWLENCLRSIVESGKPPVAGQNSRN